MDFKNEWLEHFAKNISKSTLRKKVIGRGNFLWHIFSWDIVDKDKYLVGNHARKEFNNVDKSEAKYFYLWEEKPSVKLVRKEMDAEYIDKYEEVYVVASDWSWTYIKTHEENCGPYFYRV